MDSRIGQIIEGTVFLIAMYLIVKNGSAFSEVIKAFGQTYAGSVGALQGR